MLNKRGNLFPFIKGAFTAHKQINRPFLKRADCQTKLLHGN